MKITNLDKEFEQLIRAIKSYDGRIDIDKVKEAWEFAKLAHTGQKRLSGEKYITHPLEVAKILVEWKLDTTSIIAALLHDTIEDGGATRDDIVENFGKEAAQLVDGVTHVTEIRLAGSREQAFVENLRKMILTMAKDLRVVLVKLADRLHNMRTLSSLTPRNQKKNAVETLEIYAPLAERFGIGEVRSELEDLAFSYLYPQEYKELKKEVKVYYKKAEKYTKEMKENISKNLEKERIKAEINARKKHLYALWIKLKRPEIDGDLEKIYDIVALRILVDETPDCYLALGLVHSLYKPIPYIGVSDFIAQPKPNDYRSIHTKVFGPEERSVEVQIRTHKMHEQAEFGIAAHWSYSLAKKKGVKDELLEKGKIRAPKGKINWVKQLVKWQKDIRDSEEFLKAVKFDIFRHRNFVFSPKGDVYDLPSGATPVDFAYTVHTALGGFIKSAKVNGKMVPLSARLKSGDVIEIVKTKNPKKPSHRWLEFVKTTTARREIQKSLKGQSD